MRVSDEVRDCVCFIEARWPTGESMVSTAFFGAVTVREYIFRYVVTARHCVVGRQEDVDKLGQAPGGVLKVNSLRGVTTVAYDTPSWMFHPTADVAVLRMLAVDPALEIRCWDLEGSCATNSFVAERSIGAGDDAYTVGLLVVHPGRSRIMPVVRMGSIAALPDEPVLLSTGPDRVALIEVRSIGGHSGSPVFVHLPFWRDMEKGSLVAGVGAQASSGGHSYLLGVMRGFYKVRANDPEGIAGSDPTFNSGIAVVSRVDRVLDLVNSPREVELRERLSDGFDEMRRAMAKIGYPLPSGDAGPEAVD